MALLYSFQNREPAPLPERIRLEDGMTVRPPLSAEVLGELGYSGPIAVPSFDAETQVRVWDTNDMVYRVQELAPQELEARALKKQAAAANPRQFYNGLISGAAYQEIRSQATESLALTVACTEFIAAMSDAKAGEPNFPAIQACINNILEASSLEDEHLQEIYLHANAAGLWGLITLGEFEPVIPDPAPEPEPEPALAPEPTPEPVVITPESEEEEGGDTIIFSGGTTSAGITSGTALSGTQIFGSAGEDVVTFDDPLA